MHQSAFVSLRPRPRRRFAPALTATLVARSCIVAACIAPLGIACAAAAEKISEATAGAMEACAFNDPPGILEGAFASQQEMQGMGTAVRDYVKTMQTSLQCLDDLSNSTSESESGFVVAMYNNGVDQLNTVVAHYNEQVKLYKRYERTDPAQ